MKFLIHSNPTEHILDLPAIATVHGTGSVKTWRQSVMETKCQKNDPLLHVRGSLISPFHQDAAQILALHYLDLSLNVGKNLRDKSPQSQ